MPSFLPSRRTVRGPSLPDISMAGSHAVEDASRPEELTFVMSCVSLELLSFSPFELTRAQRSGSKGAIRSSLPCLTSLLFVYRSCWKGYLPMAPTTGFRRL